jgi:transcription initiation factor TFIIA small subunit
MYFFRKKSFAHLLTCPSTHLQGSLDTYRFCDEVWTFQLKNVTFKMENGGQVVSADRVKIVSCTAKPTGATT